MSSLSVSQALILNGMSRILSRKNKFYPRSKDRQNPFIHCFVVFPMIFCKGVASLLFWGGSTLKMPPLLNFSLKKSKKLLLKNKYNADLPFYMLQARIQIQGGEKPNTYPKFENFPYSAKK